MKQAVKGASKWLIEHSTRNPVPYRLFRSILDKQIEWARNNRGVAINFGELSEAVKAELLKGGIYVMSEDGHLNKPERNQDTNTASLFGENGNAQGEFSPLTLSLSGNQPILTAFLGWLHSVFNQATNEGITELHFSVKTH